MHLVFATSLVPDGTPTSGYEIANAAILDGLRRAGVKVTVLGFAWPGRLRSSLQDAVVLGEVDVQTEMAGALRKLRWAGGAIVRGLTVSSAKLRIVSPQTVRNALALVEPFDGYVLNSVQLAGAFEEVFADRPTIYVAHNVEHRSARENAAAARSSVESFLFRREARLLEAIEHRLCERAKFTFTLSEEDRRLLGFTGEQRSAVLPIVAGVPAAPLDSRRTEYDATLIGTWTWAPNRIGLEWFLDEVVPLLPSSFSIAIGGSTPAGFAARYPNVRFVGRVPDAVAFMRSGKVVPLISRAGTGVQIKTLETFEQGLPSIATTHSLRGIAHLPENCVVTDDPQVFAAALQAAAAGQPKDVDGRTFHRSQRQALDAAIRRGLERFGLPGERRAA